MMTCQDASACWRGKYRATLPRLRLLQVSTRISSSQCCVSSGMKLMQGYQLTLWSAYNCLVLYVCNLAMKYMIRVGMKDEPKKPKRVGTQRNIIRQLERETVVSIIIEIRCLTSRWYICITSCSTPVAVRIHSIHP